MAEPGLGDYILVNRALILALAGLLEALDMVTPDETAAVFRLASEGCGGAAKDSLLALADNWEKDHEPGWTPEVIPGGKDGGDGDA